MRDPGPAAGALHLRPLVDGVIAGEAAKSRKNAEELLATFDAAADKAGILHETILENVSRGRPGHPRGVCAASRPDDPADAEVSDQWYAEAIIFGSGRPTLILPESRSAGRSSSGRSRSPGISAAPPRARFRTPCRSWNWPRQVRIVTVINEKALGSRRSGEELAKNLARHGIDVVLDNVDAKGHPIGEVLESWTSSQGADLLVMGAYGHSRWREFVLGGATRSLLSKPSLPILLSH